MVEGVITKIVSLFNVQSNMQSIVEQFS
jgi:hypothetical protein